ncbi:hypothetical protein HDK64DRAFT_304394 [Phyllosticta capitalensis]
MAPITVAVAYPNVPDATFDHDYYVKTHMDMLEKAFGNKILGWRALRITQTITADPSPYSVMTLMEFPDRKTWEECLALIRKDLIPDIQFYSNKTPVFLVAEPFGGLVGSFGRAL